MRRSRPCFAEPPAESPSTRNSSESAGSFSWQSASLPGRPAISSAPLRRVSSRALRAASRARAASMIFATIARRLRRILEQELAEFLGDDRFDDALDLRRDELVLGLRRKLRIGQLHREHGGQAFARIVAGGRHAVFLVRELALDVVVERARQCAAKSGEVRAAVASAECCSCSSTSSPGRNRSTAWPSSTTIAVTFAAEPDNCVVDRGLAAIQVADEFADAALVVEHLAAIVTLVDELDSHARIQERQLAQALLQHVVLELDIREDLVARLEADRSCRADRSARRPPSAPCGSPSRYSCRYSWPSR